MTAASAPITCPYCSSEVGDAVPAKSCPDCAAAHHEECWEENEGCAVVSCIAGPAGLPDLAPPAAYSPPLAADYSAAPASPGGPKLPEVEISTGQVPGQTLGRSSTTGPVSFGEAISDGFARYAQFSGRASRSAYWWWQLFLGLIVFGSFITAAISEVLFVIAFWGAVLGLIVPTLALTVRRLHDMNVSAWGLLAICVLNIIPFGGIAVLIWMCMPGTAGDNQYGPGY